MMSLITDHPVTVILHCVYRLHSPAAADRATQGPSDLFPQKLICGLHKQATELWQMERRGPPDPHRTKCKIIIIKKNKTTNPSVCPDDD